MSLAEALSYPLALSISPNRMRMLLDNAAKALGLTITPFVEAETTHTISLLVKEGLACTIRPYVGALPVTKDGLAHIRLSEPALQRRLSAVSSAQASLNPAGRATLSVLIELSKALNPV